MADDILLEDGKGIDDVLAILAVSAPNKEGKSTFLNRWRDGLLTPVDGASLAVFRISFGLLMFWDVCRYWIYGWIASDLVEPTFHFTYFLFPFVRPWPGEGMYWHFAALGLLALLMTVGLFYRLATWGFFVGFTYVFLLDEAYYLNHNYLICLLSFLMAIVPAQSAWSLDAWRRRKETGFSTSRNCRFYDGTVPRWSVLLLRTQVSLVYFYAGIAKLNYDWLVRDEALLFWLKARANWPIVAPLLAAPVLVALLTYGSTLFDLLVGFLLWGRRTFWPAATVAVFFHLLNSFLFPIGVFPWLMLATLTLFPKPGWPRKWFRKTSSAIQAHAPHLGSARQNTELILLHLYLIVQLLMPWRHWLYPGNVSWTEQGHRFSWHMMLRHKDVAKFTMYLTNPQTGARREIDPVKYLTPRQVRQMSYRPDMILQFAHHVAALEQESTGVRPVVNVRVSASLNARPFQDLIDPKVDLAAQPVSLAPAHWIVPLRPVW